MAKDREVVDLDADGSDDPYSTDLQSFGGLQLHDGSGSETGLYDPSGAYGLPTDGGGFEGDSGESSPFESLLDAVDRLIASLDGLKVEVKELRGDLPGLIDSMTSKESRLPEDGAAVAERAEKKAADDERKKNKEEGKRKREELEKKLAPFDAAKGAIDQSGNLAKNVASNDTMGAFNKVVGGVSDTLAKLGPAGAVAGKALEVAGSAVNKFVDVVDALNQRAAELAKYNGDLASSQAQRQLRDLQADIHEADVLGKSLSNVDEQSSEISVMFREAMLPFKEILSDVVGGLLELLKPFIEIATGACRIVKLGYDFIKPTMSAIFDAMMKMLDWIGRIGKSQEEIQRDQDAARMKKEMQSNGFWGAANVASGRERGEGIFASSGGGEGSGGF